MATSYPPAPKKKTSPLVWILVGILGFIMLTGVLVVGAGVYAFYKVKQAGFDPELWAKNPGLAATRMIAAFHPEAEVVKLDERRSRITVRDKRTGKVVTLNFADIKRGRFSFEGDSGEQMSVEAGSEGDSAAVQVKGPAGSMRLASGRDVKMPSWVPLYAGATPEVAVAAQGGERGDEGSFHFLTRDSAAEVERFYGSALSKAGFTVQTTKAPGGPTVVSAGSDDGRHVDVTATAAGEATRVTVIYTGKQ